MKRILVIVALFSLLGCSTAPKIRSSGQEIVANKDGEAATLNKDSRQEFFTAPAGSTLVITKSDNGVVEEWRFPSPVTYSAKKEAVVASTGGVDVSVAKAKIEEGSRKWLVWAGIGFIGVGAVLAFNPLARYPLGGIGLGGTGAILLFAHSNPTMFYLAVGVGALALGLIFGGEIMERIKKNESK